MDMDAESGERVVSPIRAGMKREFTMLMKAQSEMGELSSTRRRVTRSQSVGDSNKGNVDKIGEKVQEPGSKRTKKDVGVELRGLEVVQPLCAESTLSQVGEHDKTVEGADLGSVRIGEATNGFSENSTRRFTRSALNLQDVEIKLEPGAEILENGGKVILAGSPLKLEMKMSKKIGLKKVPIKLKDLLETGLLEGLNVRYIRGTKSRMSQGSELHGFIRGAGILCSCVECKGEKVLTPDQFELHAHSGYNCPSEYIYLENGNRLQDVLNACRVAHSESLELVIRNAIGRSDSRTPVFCLNCKGLIPEAGVGRPMLLCDSCVPKDSGTSFAQAIDTPHRSLVADSPAPVVYTDQHGLLESARTLSKGRSRVKPQGKLTKKDLGLHRIVFTTDVLPDGAALYYVLQGKKQLEGYKKDGAIFCLCCENVVSPSQFEAHAGFASRRKPYDNIFTSNGLSLHKLSLELSKNRKSKENDDLCSICEDGGDLVCCEKCPRAFHTECVGFSSIPQGIWYCRYCEDMFEKSKLEESSANAIAAGRVAGVDPLEEITRRCIRIVETSKSERGGCAICRNHDFTKKVFDDRTVIICDQCEKDYHVGCLREQKMDDLKALPEGDWFCCRQCSNVNSTLWDLIVSGNQKLPEALSNNVKKKFVEQDSEQNHDLDIQWRLLKGKGGPEATRKSLSEAVSIFHDRFDPIADFSTSSVDLIPHMVYGRPFKGQDYGGMYCAVLLVNSIVVSAALFRVFGEEVAEIPLVATKTEYQGKGLFQSLFFCIENLLASLNVKDLVLPAADEAESLWKNRFGFEKLEQEQVDRYKTHYHQMMIFQETSVLHKLISKSEITSTPLNDEKEEESGVLT